jgi:DNA-directed RNA polymerase delta subunit
MFDYQKISTELIKDLPERTRDVIQRRFSLDKESVPHKTIKFKKESLGNIGKDYGITRERVRQIESDGFKRIKKKIGDYQHVYQAFGKKLDEFGGIKKEEDLFESLADKKNFNHLFFILSVADSFHRFPGNRSFHSFWTKDPSNLDYTQETVSAFYNVLEKEKKPMVFQECGDSIPLATGQKFFSAIETSKDIRKNKEGFVGLKTWPEINPRGSRDKAYLVLKKEGKPLHFTSISRMIDQSTLPQTVHNELIKDPRFVLIGRGTYALKEWGYKEGEVKDVIMDILEKSKKPLARDEIVERVLKQRMVKKNTVIQNLSSVKTFVRNSEGKYYINKENL